MKQLTQNLQKQWYHKVQKKVGNNFRLKQIKELWLAVYDPGLASGLYQKIVLY